MLAAGMFGGFALLAWGAYLGGDPSFSGIVIPFTVGTAASFLALGLMYAFPPDWPRSFEVGSRELRIGYRRRPALVIPWVDPQSSLMVVDTPATRGGKVLTDRPILIAFGGRFVARVSQQAMDALKEEMTAQGYRFTYLEGPGTRRLKFRLGDGSTVLRIERS